MRDGGRKKQRQRSLGNLSCAPPILQSPEHLKTSANLKRMTCCCLIRRKQGSFRKSGLDKVDDGYMKPVTQRRKPSSRPCSLHPPKLFIVCERSQEWTKRKH